MTANTKPRLGNALGGVWCSTPCQRVQIFASLAHAHRIGCSGT
jgi:hypothetical protein